MTLPIDCALQASDRKTRVSTFRRRKSVEKRKNVSTSKLRRWLFNGFYSASKKRWKIDFEISTSIRRWNIDFAPWEVILKLNIIILICLPTWTECLRAKSSSLCRVKPFLVTLNWTCLVFSVTLVSVPTGLIENIPWNQKDKNHYYNFDSIHDFMSELLLKG